MRVHHSSTGMGKAAMFKMRPRMGFIWLAICIALLGGLYAVSLHGESTYDPSMEAAARLVTLITTVLVLLCLIIATARMWYAHLWHRRK